MLKRKVALRSLSVVFVTSVVATIIFLDVLKVGIETRIFGGLAYEIPRISKPMLKKVIQKPVNKPFFVTASVFLSNAKLTHGSLKPADGCKTVQGEGAEAAKAASVTEPVEL